MLLQVQHETRYRYEPGVQASEHILCLHLRDTPCQQVIEQHIHIEPGSHTREDEIDEFGNTRTHLSINTWHDSFSALSKSKVRTMRVDAPLPAISCEQAVQRIAANARLQGLVNPTLQTVHEPALREYAAQFFQPENDLLQSCAALMHNIQQNFAYVPNSTTIYTPVMQVFAQKSGVCQDFTHLMLSALRSMGLACRYVSGYLLTLPPPGQEKLVGVDASHAWVSVFVPTSPQARKGYWYDFCPTNGRWGFASPGEDFVTLSYGRDYHDVSPVRGMLTGAGSQTMQVGVDVQALDE